MTELEELQRENQLLKEYIKNMTVKGRPKHNRFRSNKEIADAWDSSKTLQENAIEAGISYNYASVIKYKFKLKTVRKSGVK